MTKLAFVVIICKICVITIKVITKEIIISDYDHNNH